MVFEELRKLSKIVNKELKSYDKPAKGIAAIMDNLGWLTSITGCAVCGATIGAVIRCVIATMG